jgi:hypothetical protein
MPLIRSYTVNRNAPLAGLHVIRTIDPYAKVWEYLRRFRSVQYCERYLRNLIPVGSPHLALVLTKARQIASIIEQAEQYFNSARDSAWQIRPLLTYYGMVGLAKCLILAGDNGYTLESTNPSSAEQEMHGLSWKTQTPADNAIRDGNGLLDEFCYVRTSTNRSGLYTLLRRCYAINDVPNGSRFSIRELLSLIPDLQREFAMHLQSQPRTWQCESRFGQNVISDRYHVLKFVDYDALLLGTPGAPAMLTQCFPELGTLYAPLGGDQFVSVAECQSADDHIYATKAASGITFAYMRIGGYVLTDSDVDYMLMFILSNLVRYRQDKWSELVNRTNNDDIFLVDSAVELATLKFPRFVLNELEGRDYFFAGQASLWG